MANHIVLFEPLMPANTGNIARTCAGTDTILDLIEPLGFKLDNKHLKRAGLDYWNKVQINYHQNLPEFLKTVENPKNLFFGFPSLPTKTILIQIIQILNRTIIYCLVRKQQGYPNPLCERIRKRPFEFPKTMIIFEH